MGCIMLAPQLQLAAGWSYSYTTQGLKYSSHLQCAYVGPCRRIHHHKQQQTHNAQIMVNSASALSHCLPSLQPER